METIALKALTFFPATTQKNTPLRVAIRSSLEVPHKLNPFYNFQLITKNKK